MARQHIAKECRHCKGKEIIKWGYYIRKCKSEEGVRRIPIRRFFCKSCKKTFNYLPPFLIPYKQYDIAVLRGSLKNIFEKGVSYLKSTTGLLDVSTVVRYAKHYLRRSGAIVRKIKEAVLNWAPGYSFEKDPRLIEGAATRRKQVKQALILSETLIQLAFSDRRHINIDPLNMLHFVIVR